MVEHVHGDRVGRLVDRCGSRNSISAGVLAARAKPAEKNRNADPRVISAYLGEGKRRRDASLP